MSQYFPPSYPPPQGPLGFEPFRRFGDPLTPARRAATMLWVLGALCILGGACALVVVWLVPLDVFIKQVRQSLSPAQQKELAGFDWTAILRTLYSVVGAVALIIGLIMVIAAPFVRKGRRGAILTALVLAILLGLWCVLAVLGGLAQAAGGSAAALGGVIIWVLIGAVIGLLIGWLGQALRASRKAWAHPPAPPQFGQMQGPIEFGPAGYGYAPPPPPPPGGTPQHWMPPPPPLPPPAPLPPPPQFPTGESDGKS